MILSYIKTESVFLRPLKQQRRNESKRDEIKMDESKKDKSERDGMSAIVHREPFCFHPTFSINTIQTRTIQTNCTIQTCTV